MKSLIKINNLLIDLDGFRHVLTSVLGVMCDDMFAK